MIKEKQTFTFSGNKTIVIPVDKKPQMTKEERQLVIEYINTVDAWPLFEQFDKDKQDRLLENLFDTFDFKLYALKHAWRELIDKLIFWK